MNSSSPYGTNFCHQNNLKRTIKVYGKYFFSAPAMLWLSLWFGINTGPWNLIEVPTSLLGWIHAIRTVFPLVALLAAVLFIGSKTARGQRILPGPVKLWLIYGMISLLSGLMSPSLFHIAYWALAYLSTFAVLSVCLRGKDPIKHAIQLNHFTWIITSIFLTILVLMARDVLFRGSGLDMTGYGVIGAKPTVGDMAMSRSSGLARFASVPGVISFTYLWKGPVWKRIPWIFIFLFSIFFLYTLQSRGALAGFGFSLAFLMLFQGRKSRRVGMFLVVIFGLASAFDFFPTQTVDKISHHLSRGEDGAQLGTMGGRTRAWEASWKVIVRSPILGYGHMADRWLIKEHVHNTYMYVIMASGFLGALFFVSGLFWVWLKCFHILVRGTADRTGQKIHFLQAMGILAFFTVRSIPEVCGALFGVDTMVMLPAMAYISILARHESHKNSTSLH